MKLKEFLIGKQTPATSLGALKFKRGVFNEDIKTPHYEMDKSIEAYYSRGQIASSINQIVSFILGKKLFVKSADKKTMEWYEAFFNKRKEFRPTITNFITLTLMTGNGYLEPAYFQGLDGNQILDNVFAIPDSSRIHINLDPSEDESDFYIYEVPREAGNTAFYKGKTPQQFRLNYVRGSKIFPQLIWGIPIDRSQLWHLKYGFSRDGIYGRGFLASVIDDVEITNQILLNYATIARYRAIGKKIFTVGTDENPGTPDDVEKLTEELNNPFDEQHIVINKPFKQADMSFQGQTDPMNDQIEYLRNDTQSGLVPNHMTSWAGTTTFATAGRAQIPFELFLDNFRELIVEFMNNNILKAIRKTNPHLADDATFVMGEDVDLDATEDRMNWSSTLYANNAITLNEYRKSAGYDPVAQGDIWGWENEPPLDQVRFTRQITSAPDGNDSTPFNDSFHEKLDAQEFNLFLRRLGVSSKSKYEEVKNNDVGGHELRLVRTPSNLVLYDGMRPLNIFDLEDTELANMAFDNEKKKIIKSFDQIIEGETEEDKIMKDLFSQVKRLQAATIEQLFDEINASKVKKEAFLSSSILGKIAGLFSLMSPKLRQLVNDSVLKIMNLNISKDNPNNPAVPKGDKALKKLLTDRGRILRQNIFNQLKTYNQQTAQGIRRDLTDGITAGQSINEIKQTLKDKYAQWKTKPSVQDFNINRIVRTEVNKASSLLKLKKWAEMGFTKFLWNSREDPKVRPSHAKRNQRVFLIDDALSGKIIFPGGSLSDSAPDAPNINCRCSVSLYE